MTQKTALYSWHKAHGAKIVPFSGWDMPVNYGSQIDEHNAVRNNCGLFDVSHMAVVDIVGDDAHRFLQYVIANDVARLKKDGAALYSCMLNHDGGIIDDLIVYKLNSSGYRAVVNAGTAANDIEWMTQQSTDFAVDITRRQDLSMIAVQGPNAVAKMTALGGEFSALIDGLEYFHASWNANDLFIGRTGYTGEDGFEIVLPHAQVEQLWTDLLAQGAEPCGLGARDTLRLEAGMNLYGQDMTTDIRPTECGLKWTLAMSDDREFIGKSALSAPPRFVQSGIILKERGVLRSHQPLVFTDGQLGEVTSGTFSPTMKQSIGFARIPSNAGDKCAVDIRGRQLECELVKLPFVKRGKILVAV